MKSPNHCSRDSRIDCRDIYIEETAKSINALKRFREAWLRSPSSWNTELFQYGDPDFYFYRFAVDRQERNVPSLLRRILYRVMERYGVSLAPEDYSSTPFQFIVCSNNIRKGYTFENFYDDEDIDAILRECNVREAIIIRTWKPGRTDEWVERENQAYQLNEPHLSAIRLKDFFDEYFGEDEYSVFSECLNGYLQASREITGYQSVKFLSLINLASQKLYEEKVLEDWPYESYQYQILDKENAKIKDKLYISEYIFPSNDFLEMERKYVKGKLLRAMVGSKEFALSFITSEWLYHSLNRRKNFDYTSVISGYLKSIEQLLCEIVMLNVDNECKISISGEKSKRTEAYNKGVIIYKRNKDDWDIIDANKKQYMKSGHPYIDLTSDNIEYMDSSIGTFEHFLKNNTQIFINSRIAKPIVDMISCFRTECRNGFFHTHNLDDWDVVEKTRSNAIYLYFVLLGAITLGENSNLGILSTDDFDVICQKIREFRHFNVEFIFEYENRKRVNLIYDFYNNTVEYNDDGTEHYENLLFYAVEEFSVRMYEELEDEDIREKKEFLFTRNNIPQRIYGVHRDGRLEEITLS